MRQAEESARKAAALNAAEEARKVQNWRIGRQIKKMQEAAQPLDDALEDEEKAWLKDRLDKNRKPRQVPDGVPIDPFLPLPPGPVCAPTVLDKPKPWWQIAGSLILPNAGYIGTAGLAGYTAYGYRGLTINNLYSGKVSVSAGNMPPGTRAAYFSDLDIPLRPGGNYLPSTVREGLMDGITRGATNGLSWTVAGVGSLISNLYTFGRDHTSSADDFVQSTVAKQEFWTSTVVDTVLSVAIGVGAAALVVATLPVTVPTAGLAIAAGLVAVVTTVAIYAPISDGKSVSDVIKSGINQIIDMVQDGL